MKRKIQQNGRNVSEEEKVDVADSVTRIVCKGKAPVDTQCTAKINVAHVYCEGDDVFDVLLNQTNLNKNNNKYYIIQLLEDDSVKNYSVWFRWGRVGKVGQNKLECCGFDLGKAKQMFLQKFFEKTLNDWNDRKGFIKHDGKYDLVELDYGFQNENVAPKPAKSKQIESTLPAPIQALIKLIFDFQNMEQTVAELSYDSRRVPLGKLSKAQIKAGYTALDTISNLIFKLNNVNTEGTEVRPNGRPKRAKYTINDGKKLNEELLKACNEFYTRIPHDFGMRVPPLIRSLEEVKTKLELLQALDDIEFAVNIMKDDKNTFENLVDLHYRRLACDIKHLESSNLMYSILQDYLKITHGPTHKMYTLELLNIFECRRPAENDTFQDFGNRMLLWHGSRVTNWVGILGRGLQIAPPEAPSTGYMFGKGVYFADCSSKSANYAYPTRTKNVGIMALCEVSLGNPRELYQACYNAHKQAVVGTHSVKGVGKLQPDVSSWKTLEDGLKIPAGKLIKPDGLNENKCVLQFNEYVVYNINQIRLRYLMQIKFNFV